VLGTLQSEALTSERSAFYVFESVLNEEDEFRDENAVNEQGEGEVVRITEDGKESFL
jgi:hypothetical protein